MTMTIDIPDELYRELESQGKRESKTPAVVLLERVERPAQSGRAEARGVSATSDAKYRVKFPLLSGGEPGPLVRDRVNLNQTMFMTDGEIDDLCAS